MSGTTGDAEVKWKHRKPAGEPVGPFEIEFDFTTGGVHRVGGFDLLAALRAAPGGLTAADAAPHFEGASESAKNKNARRKLNTLVAKGLARKVEGAPTQGALREPDRFHAITGLASLDR